MADIRLVRPEAGTNQAVACEHEAKFVFDFPTDAATLSRNGDNLVMTFEDGATLTLTDFYKAYSSKNMPSFEVDGAQVAGADFFAAMNEPDLMPAAGPGGRGAAGVGGARYHEYANMALYDGLDRLDGLDVGWPDGGYEPEIDGAAGTYTVAEGDSLVPPVTIPEITPDPNPENPADPYYPGPEGSVSHIVMDEGTNPESATQNNVVVAASAHEGHAKMGGSTGSFNVQLNGESGTVTLTDKYGHTVKMHIKEDGTYTLTDENGNELTGDVTLQVNGVNVTLESDGTLRSNSNGSWTVEYSYELSGPQQHAEKDNETTDLNEDTTVTGEEITITVTDASGDTATGKLTSEVHDDVPTMAVVPDNATVSTDTASVTVDMGADADDVYENADATVEVFAQDAEGNPEGKAFEWTNNDDPNQKTTDLTEMKEGDTWTSASGDVTVHKYGDRYEFTNHNEDEGKNLTVKATDADGDTVQDEVHLGEAKTDITVGTQDKDTLTPGDPSYPGDPSDPGSPDDPGNPSFESPNDTGANDFVIGDIYAQQNAGNVGNFAFLVDTSSSLSRDNLDATIEQLMDAIQSIIDALKENGGSADILVAEFNTFARHVQEFHLTGNTTTEEIEQFLDNFHIGGYRDVNKEEFENNQGKYVQDGTGLNESKDTYFATEDKVSEKYHAKFGTGTRGGATNYEHAMDVAKQWFEGKETGTGKNQTFFITDGVPTGHVSDEEIAQDAKVKESYNGGWSTNGSTLADALKSCGWHVGESAQFECNGKTLYVDEAGVLYFDEDHTQLVCVEGSTLEGNLCYYPLIVQESESSYEVHQVTGNLVERNMFSEIEPSKKALDELSDVSDVVILGVGDSFKKQVNTDKDHAQGPSMTGEEVLDNLTENNNNVTTQTGLGFDKLAEAIQKSLKALDPASDLLIGGKGNDILFGDRVDYNTKTPYAEHGDAVEATQAALFAMAFDVAGKLGVTAPTNNLADLAGFIREHAKDFGDTLDAKFMDKSGGSDVLIGGTGHDVLYGQGGDDLLIGDGGQGYLDYLTENKDELSNLREELIKTEAEPTDSLKKLDEFENADTAHGDDLLFGGSGNDILLGGAGNDKLFGGKGEDILYGGSGNDYLDGGEGRDYLYGGAGDDLIVYDETDYAVFGGDGIDVLLSNGTDDTLSDLNGKGGKPHVNGVEVFLKGDETHKDARGFDVEDLTSLSDLAKKAGITITDTDGDGNGDRLTLGQGWMKGEASNTYVNNELGLTVELQNMEQVDPDTEQLVFQLQNTNS